MKKTTGLYLGMAAALLLAGIGGGAAYSISKIESLKKDNETQLALIDELSLENETLKAEKEELEASIAEKDARLITVNAELTAARNSLAEVNLNLASANELLASERAAKAQLQARLDEEIAAKESLQEQLNSANADVEAINVVIDEKNENISLLQSQIAQKDVAIESLTVQVNTLQAEAVVLNNTIVQLNAQLEEIHTQIEDLQQQLDAFEQYTINIDHINEVEAIIVTDTKLNTVSALSNPESINQLQLYSWQDAQIKYAEVVGGVVYAVCNGVQQDNNIANIVCEPGQIVNVSSLFVETITPVEMTSAANFKFDNGTITGFSGQGKALYDSGELTELILPSSYSLGEMVETTLSINQDNWSDFDFRMREEQNVFPFTYTLDDITYTCESEDDWENIHPLEDAIMADNETVDVIIHEQGYIDGDDYTITTIGGSAFGEYSNLTLVIIPNSVTSIGQGAFEDCSSLTSITIPNSVTNIGDDVFMSCTGLISVTINNNNISTFEFYGCSSLTSITIPSNVSSIAREAFRECSSLTSVIVEATIPPVFSDPPGAPSGIVYSDFTNDCIIYVPAQSVDAYKAAYGWSEYADRIQAIVE